MGGPLWAIGATLIYHQDIPAQCRQQCGMHNAAPRSNGPIYPLWSGHFLLGAATLIRERSTCGLPIGLGNRKPGISKIPSQTAK